MANDMSAVIVPKSDQINADDLIAGPITIHITSVSVRPGTEQPVSMFFDGDGGKPFKPCKSMARVMVAAWGPDSSKYVGRSLTLYRDPKVKWGGLEVGGIRISHMTDISSAMTMALTETKQSRKPFTVKPLTVEKTQPKPRDNPAPMDDDACKAWGDNHEHVIDLAEDADKLDADLRSRCTSPEYKAFKAHDPTRADMLATKARDRLAKLRGRG